MHSLPRCTVAEQLAEATYEPEGEDEHHIEDDQLRLIFTCCHPSLAPEAKMALTLREVCGLTTEAIARAFLITPSTSDLPTSAFTHHTRARKTFFARTT